MFAKEDILAIASDHAGFALKSFLIQELENMGYHLKDYGTHSEGSVDYPDYIHPLANEVNRGKYKAGIIICGSGQGASMVANKYPQVRAALCWNEQQAELSRLHNNANIVSLPGRFVSPELAFRIVLKFLNTDFEGGRHSGRVSKIPILHY
jgi:ribose 5-phosphate isomerase B